MADKREHIQILEDTTLYEKGYSRIVVRHFLDRSDTKREWGMVHLNTFGPSAAVLALTDHNEFIFERSFRIPLKESVIELPGGCMDIAGEGPAEVAKRELLEETGYTAEHFEEVALLADAPGVSDEKTVLFLAHSAKKTAEPSLGPGEVIETVLVPAAKAMQILSEEVLVDPRVFAAIAHAFARRLIAP